VSGSGRFASPAPESDLESGAIKCAPGFVCELLPVRCLVAPCPVQPQCRPVAPGACARDTDRRKVDSDCGACGCLALGPGEGAPTCENPVACFAQPCAVTPGQPKCVNARCVLQ
jgi:hypothetical protein